MDFTSILYSAQKNDQDNGQSKGWYKTGFAPPKKEQREKKLSINIQKFLARKEEEERQKKLEAERKKQELLALRSQDKKSVKRVQSMLKRTKSANKSVLDDAIDHENTAVTAAGPLQPDEDDYGYVSKDASELYNQLINKYNSMPSEDSLFKKSSNKTAKDITTTKDRVKAALQREEDEKLLPRKRKRKSKESGENAEASEGEDFEEQVPEKKPEEKPKPEKFKIPKKNSQAPPPLDFQSLLKLAEKKQFEPIVIQKPVEEKPERPMTQKEKLEFMRERERKMRREMQVTNNSKSSEMNAAKKVKLKSDTPSSTSLKNELNNRSQKTRPESSTASSSKTIRETSSSRGKPAPSEVKKPTDKAPVRTDRPKSMTDKPKLTSDKSKVTSESSRLTDKPKPAMSDSQKAMLMKKAKEQYLAEQKRSLTSKSTVDSRDRERVTKTNDVPPKTAVKQDPKVMDRKAVPSGKKMTSAREEIKQFPPRDMVRQFPPRDMVKQFPPPDMNKKPPPKPVRRKFIESDDEYDSEMDDFIDDSEDTNDVSKYISEIFGYDRRKYSKYDRDDDDECMESNFSDLQKEEFISTKYGIMEDLADVRRTKLEKERKKKRMLSR